MPHLDEGTIHAWLDGALAPDESARAEAHVAECPTCAAAVAEARGVIAAASRILTALDEIPGDVIPAGASGSEHSLAAWRAQRARARSRRWATRLAPVAAVLAFVAVGVVVARQPASEKASVVATDGDARLPAPVTSPLQEPPAAAPSSAAPPARTEMAQDAIASAPVPRTPSAPQPAEGAASGAVGSRLRRDAAVVEEQRSLREQERANDELQKSTIANAIADSAPDTARAKEAYAATPAPGATIRTRGFSGPAGAAIRGRVTDERGAPLPSAQVVDVGTKSGDMTDSAGRFELENIPAGERTLEARRVGYASTERKVQARAGESVEVDLALPPSSMQLSEVQVVGAVAGASIPARRIAGMTLVSTTDTSLDGRAGRRSTYRLSSGEPVTLVEVRSAPRSEPQEAASGKVSADAPVAQRQAPAKARVAPMNTIWWTTPGGTEITLFGAVSVEELERIRRAMAP